MACPASTAPSANHAMILSTNVLLIGFILCLTASIPPQACALEAYAAYHALNMAGQKMAHFQRGSGRSISFVPIRHARLWSSNTTGCQSREGGTSQDGQAARVRSPVGIYSKRRPLGQQTDFPPGSYPRWLGNAHLPRALCTVPLACLLATALKGAASSPSSNKPIRHTVRFLHQYTL